MIPSVDVPCCVGTITFTGYLILASVCYFRMQACLYSNRYICFAADGEQWVLYDDQTAKVTNKIQKPAVTKVNILF